MLRNPINNTKSEFFFDAAFIIRVILMQNFLIFSC